MNSSFKCSEFAVNKVGFIRLSYSGSKCFGGINGRGSIRGNVNAPVFEQYRGACSNFRTIRVQVTEVWN